MGFSHSGFLAYPVHQMTNLISLCLFVALSVATSGCSVIAVAGAAVTVVATTVKVGTDAVGTTVDVAAAGGKAVT